MRNIIENTVGRGVYETWATGATRQIENLEIKLIETCDFLTGQVSEVIAMLEKYRPSQEVLDSDPKEREIWKEVKQLKSAIINRVNHLLK